MDYKNVVKEMMDLFQESNLTSLDVEIPGVSLSMTKESRGKAPKEEVVYVEKEVDRVNSFVEISDNSSNKEYVKAPLVGTLYLSPEPNKPHFVSEGQRVKEGDTICIIEAMKMMNELKAPYDLIIKAILEDNEKMVEYDQAIFEVERC